ncbi:MAG: GNAT family N-acetyltransferase [Nostoc sp. LLA-1]|nr:GNAT family N-acetyltransferase [Cyanocohniella sp. LLY]
METQLIFLRSLETKDAEKIHKWHNSPELYTSLLNPFRWVSLAVVEDWLCNKQSYLSNEINLAICLTSDLQHIGNIYLRNIDWTSRNGELNIFIGEPEERSKGYGKAAINLLLNYAFQNLGLLRVYLYVMASNIPAIKTYEKCGFITEGKLSRHIFKDGKFQDVLVMGNCVDNI